MRGHEYKNLGIPFDITLAVLTTFQFTIPMKLLKPEAIYD